MHFAAGVRRSRVIRLSYSTGFFMLAAASKRERAIRLVYPPVYCELAFLDAAACTKKTEDQLRRTTFDLSARVTKCTEVYGGLFENLF
jgi:hypothetical protein